MFKNGTGTEEVREGVQGAGSKAGEGDRSGKGSEGTGDTGGSLYGWQKAVREGRLDAGPGSRGPVEAMSLAEELGDAAQADQGAGAGEPAAERRERVFSGGQLHFLNTLFEGRGAIMVRPFAPFFTCHPNWFFHLLNPATWVALGICIWMRMVLLEARSRVIRKF